MRSVWFKDSATWERGPSRKYARLILIWLMLSILKSLFLPVLHLPLWGISLEARWILLLVLGAVTGVQCFGLWREARWTLGVALGMVLVGLSLMVPLLFIDPRKMSLYPAENVLNFLSAVTTWILLVCVFLPALRKQWALRQASKSLK